MRAFGLLVILLATLSGCDTRAGVGDMDAGTDDGAGCAYWGVDAGVARVAHFNGSDWDDSWPGAPGQFRAVWGSGPDDVWAAGVVAVHGGVMPAGLFYRWDGASWAQFPAPAEVDDSVWSLWGSGPSDFWAAAGAAGLFHWDGSTWTMAPTDDLGLAYGVTFWRVFGLAPDDVWAIDLGLLRVLWDGTTWSRVETDWGSTMLAIWGSAPDDLWIAGYQPDYRTPPTVMHH